MASSEFSGQTLTAPALTEDDAFNSHPILGAIAYRLPSVTTLFGLPGSTFDTYSTLTFYLEVSNAELGTDSQMTCSTTSRCKVRYHRSYSPTVYYLSPPVVYYESYTEVWFDPKSTMNLIQDLDSDELPFINTKVGGSLLDFEFSVDHETTYSGWSRNRARGQVGQLPVSSSNNITMQWEVGQAVVAEQEMTHCSYDNLTCYKSRTVPVVHNVSSHTGYITGG